MTVLHTPRPSPEEPPATVGQRDREARLTGALNRLLERRPDLRGVYAPADHTADATRWGV